MVSATASPRVLMRPMAKRRSRVMFSGPWPERMRLRTRPSFWRAGRGSGSSTASRAGKAKKRGLSREQVPILVAADRGGETLSHTLPALNADNVKEVLEPVLAPDALLVSDANRCYPPVAAALDIPHESINASAGERVRGAVHIQTVNSRHSQIKGILRRRRGIATKYLDSYLRWFHLIALGDQPSPRACLEAAMAKPCLRFAN